MELSFSLNDVKKTLEDFYNITNFRIALFDEHFNELLAYPSRLSDFCKIIRSDHELYESCRFCDFNGFCRCQKTKEPVIYQCHMNLTEIIFPIISSNVIIGYLMCGQIHTDETDSAVQSMVCNYTSSNGINTDDLMMIHKKQPITSLKVIDSILHFLNIISNYFMSTHSLFINNNSLAYQIDQYILSHIADSLDVETLCKHFHYQKTTFYKITNNLYGMGIMKHIRRIRVQQAKILLSTTTLSISEVALSVGIEDYNYFTKIFKSEANCTPSDYRKNSFCTFVLDLHTV